jgi:ligand-binding SRPBCC domain-containing protein
MHIYTLECEMIAHRRLEEVFAVFEDPYNLAKITPASLSFQVTSKERVVMKKGAEIDYKISWLGFPMHWKTKIVGYQPPHYFVDEQAKGPYRFWRHRHTFESVSDGVKVGDHVDYVLPFGIFGRAAHGLTVRNQLLAIFNYRQEKLKGLLGNDARTTRPPEIRVSTAEQLPPDESN